MVDPNDHASGSNIPRRVQDTRQFDSIRARTIINDVSAGHKAPDISSEFGTPLTHFGLRRKKGEPLLHSVQPSHCRINAVPRDVIGDLYKIFSSPRGLDYGRHSAHRPDDKRSRTSCFISSMSSAVPSPRSSSSIPTRRSARSRSSRIARTCSRSRSNVNAAQTTSPAVE